MLISASFGTKTLIQKRLHHLVPKYWLKKIPQTKDIPRFGTINPYIRIDSYSKLLQSTEKALLLKAFSALATKWCKMLISAYWLKKNCTEQGRASFGIHNPYIRTSYSKLLRSKEKAVVLKIFTALAARTQLNKSQFKKNYNQNNGCTVWRNIQDWPE